VKNKVAPPFREAEFDIMFGQGISREGDILDIAANEGIVVKSGAWYAYKNEKIGQGRENAKQYLREHPEIFNEIDYLVRERFGLLQEGQEMPDAASTVQKDSDTEA
jgi:recombination protein RecA